MLCGALCIFPLFMCAGSNYGASLNQFAHCSSFHSLSRSVFLYQAGSLNKRLSEGSFFFIHHSFVLSMLVRLQQRRLKDI